MLLSDSYMLPLMRPPVLSRVQAFLPEFAASTTEIARRARNDPDSVDIEKLNSNSHYIKMVRPTLICLHLIIFSLSYLGSWTWCV